MSNSCETQQNLYIIDRLDCSVFILSFFLFFKESQNINVEHGPEINKVGFNIRCSHTRLEENNPTSLKPINAMSLEGPI